MTEEPEIIVSASRDAMYLCDQACQRRLMSAGIELRGEIARIRLVQAAQRVQHVHNVAGVVDHPRRILRTYNEIEVREIESAERTIAGHQVGQIALAQRELDQLGVMRSRLVDGVGKAAHEPLRPT